MKKFNNAIIVEDAKVETRDSKDGSKKSYTVGGRAVVYGKKENVGGFYEEITKGALNNTDLRDVPLFFGHNKDAVPLARSRNNTANSTLRLKLSDDGLDIEADLDVENNSEARSLYSAIERGDVSGMSFGFIVGDEEGRQEWYRDIDGKPARRINSIKKITEVSIVNNPAYRDAIIEAREYASEMVDTVKLAEKELLDSEERSIVLTMKKELRDEITKQLKDEIREEIKEEINEKI